MGIRHRPSPNSKYRSSYGAPRSKGQPDYILHIYQSKILTVLAWVRVTIVILCLTRWSEPVDRTMTQEGTVSVFTSTMISARVLRAFINIFFTKFSGVALRTETNAVLKKKDDQIYWAEPEFDPSSLIHLER